MVLKLFVQSRCAKCPQAKQTGAELQAAGYTVEEYDVATPDGLAEASFYSVQATPSCVIVDADENTVADFRGEVPDAAALRQIMGAPA